MLLYVSGTHCMYLHVLGVEHMLALGITKMHTIR